jgi:transposase InsO family protein
MQVSKSGYYAWCSRPESGRSQQNEQLVEKIRKIHKDSDCSYGSPRIHVELKEQKVSCSLNRVARLMKLEGITAKQKRKFVRTTDSDHDLPVKENKLNQEFTAAMPDQKWAADITYIWTAEGWLYLAVVLDLFSRRVVGWSMKPTMATCLVSNALQMALLGRRPAEGLLHHSDRGSQYASNDYQNRLDLAKADCSMSRKGNCYDNAVVESFFASLKRERVYQRQYRTRIEAQQDIFHYIEVWYNRKRRHSKLGYRSPEQYEQHYQYQLANCA